MPNGNRSSRWHGRVFVSKPIKKCAGYGNRGAIHGFLCLRYAARWPELNGVTQPRVRPRGGRPAKLDPVAQGATPPPAPWRPPATPPVGCQQPPPNSRPGGTRRFGRRIWAPSAADVPDRLVKRGPWLRKGDHGPVGYPRAAVRPGGSHARRRSPAKGPQRLPSGENRKEEGEKGKGGETSPPLGWQPRLGAWPAQGVRRGGRSPPLPHLFSVPPQAKERGGRTPPGPVTPPRGLTGREIKMPSTRKGGGHSPPWDSPPT